MHSAALQETAEQCMRLPGIDHLRPEHCNSLCFMITITGLLLLGPGTGAPACKGSVTIAQLVARLANNSACLQHSFPLQSGNPRLLLTLLHTALPTSPA